MNKNLTGIFAMCALLLSGCQGAKESSKEITPPDTGWGKTVDEVLADWNLDRDQVEIFSETESAAAIAVDTEATVFGEQTSRVMFQFINLDQTGATGKPVLCEVDITYPDDADMDTVKKEMEKSYGSSKDSITRYELYQSLGDDQLPEYTYKKADQPGPQAWLICNIKKFSADIFGLRLPAAASCLGRHSHLAGRGPNSSSLFPPLAAVVAVAPNEGRLWHVGQVSPERVKLIYFVDCSAPLQRAAAA